MPIQKNLEIFSSCYSDDKNTSRASMERAENDKSDDAIVTCEIFFIRGVRLIL